jgi:outer membrane autotransporter protein
LYYGLHLGTGYVWNITDKSQLDLYGKYLYGRRASDSVTLSTGDTVHFDAVHSHRLRVGTRYAWTADNIKPYLGLAYEHEFDGKAKATVYGYNIESPALKGSTGIAELGMTIKPSPGKPVSVDFGIQGYTGKREGASGSIRVEYKF